MIAAIVALRVKANSA